MPFALTFVGLVLVITGFQNTYKALGTQLQSDFSGNGNFIYWLISLGILGSLGYVDELKSFSRIFMALIIVGMLISTKGGVFQQFNSAVQSGSAAPVNPIGAPLPASGGGGGGGTSTGGGGSDTLGTVANVVSDIGTIASFF